MQGNSEQPVTAHEQHIDELSETHGRAIEEPEKMVGVQGVKNEKALWG